MEKNEHPCVKELTEIFVFYWHWIRVIQEHSLVGKMQLPQDSRLLLCRTMILVKLIITTSEATNVLNRRVFK